MEDNVTTVNYSPTTQELLNIEFAARFAPYEKQKPAQSAVYNNIKYSVEYFIAKRKCYDFMPTPTAMFKVNGKRVSRKVFYSFAVQVAA